ncbi:hypothetical protein JHK82_018950 [Glycine max]|nr:hypothetical protein JHK85_019388 [Glycine max]KAG5038126.1 hypothetical protein JHK86_018966 [Glycine max]KAG5143255.1 hypothetical protein JHK82_018950 [Glycine max]
MVVRSKTHSSCISQELENNRKHVYHTKYLLGFIGGTRRARRVAARGVTERGERAGRQGRGGTAEGLREGDMRGWVERILNVTRVERGIERETCGGCGGARFVPCFDYAGNCKIVWRGDERVAAKGGMKEGERQARRSNIPFHSILRDVLDTPQELIEYFLDTKAQETVHVEKTIQEGTEAYNKMRGELIKARASLTKILISKDVKGTMVEENEINRSLLELLDENIASAQKGNQNRTSNVALGVAWQGKSMRTEKEIISVFIPIGILLQLIVKTAQRSLKYC